MARDHYGAGATYARCRTAHQVLSAVRGGASTIGVLPIPGNDDADPWWPSLATDEPNSPRIVARIPLLAVPGQRDAAPLVATPAPQPTGLDPFYSPTDPAP